MTSALLHTVQETATMLAVSSKTVRRMLDDGRLVARRFSRNLVRVDGESVMRLLADEEPAAGANVKDEPKNEKSLGKAAKNWRVYCEPGRGFAVKYYDAAGVRRTHRIPVEQNITSQEQAQDYADEWFRANTMGARHRARPLSPTVSPRAAGRFITLEQFGKQWTGGELAKRYPDHVRAKKSAKDDAGRLARWVYPIVGGIPISEFEGQRGLELVEGVLESLPDDLAPATRRHIIQVLHRLLSLSVYPGRLLLANPLPRNFIPRAKQPRAKSFMYSDEDARLMACEQVPLLDRATYGLLDREGFRVSELLNLTWADIDLEHGIVSLDENKTDDPRSWVLDSGVVAALKVWKSMVRGRPTDPVLRGPKGEIPDRITIARRLRAHLALAGVDRPQLFEESDKRMALRAHDLRATFVTIALANGKTETFVMDRTGHKSSQMIATYRRMARSAAEARMGPLLPLNEAIPEFRKSKVESA
ncbi:MAG: hypothetical protein AMXMBFR56_41340 [Polyangiaceae bacterium]